MDKKEPKGKAVFLVALPIIIKNIPSNAADQTEKINTTKLKG